MPSTLVSIHHIDKYMQVQFIGSKGVCTLFSTVLKRDLELKITDEFRVLAARKAVVTFCHVFIRSQFAAQI
jgi:hypothetical protein